MQKKNSFTRITSGLLALVMVIGLFPMGAVRVNAEESVQQTSWYRTSVTVPSDTNYVPVTSVDDLTTYNTGWNGVTDKPYPLVLCYKGNDGNWYALNVSGTDFSLQQITVTENLDENSEKTNEYTISGNTSSWHLLRSENGWQISNSQSSMDINRKFLNFNFWGGSVALYGYDWGCEWQIQQSATAGAFNLSYTVAEGYDDKNQDGTDPHVYDKDDIISLGIDSSNALAVTKTYVANTDTSTDVGIWADLYIFAPKTAEVGNYVAIEYVQESYTVQKGDYADTSALLAMIRKDLALLLSGDASNVNTRVSLTADNNDVTYFWSKKVTNEWGGTDYTSCDTATDEGEYRLSVVYNNSLELKQITVIVEAATTITLNPTTVSLVEGENANVTATVTGANVSDVVWTSDNETIATVAETDTGATINGVNAGATTITATVDGKSATVSVTVNEPVPTVTLNQTSLSLEIGGRATLTATTSNAPDGASVTWSCDKEDVVTLAAATDVRADAVTVTADAAGSATITASLMDADGDVLDSQEVTVSVAEASTSPVVITPSVVNTVIGTTQNITLSTTGDLTITGVSWSSANESIAKLNNHWNNNTIPDLIACAEGTTTITANVTLSDNSYKTIAITVNVSKPASLVIEPSAVVMKPNTTSGIQIKLVDSNGIEHTASNEYITATSDNTNVVSYYNNTLYNYGTLGNTNVTFQLKDIYGNEVIKAVLPVTVTNATYTVDITKDNASASDFSLDIDGTAALGVTVKTAAGEAVQNPVVTWSSSNSNVAKVDENGNVTAVAPGEAIISVTYEGITDSVKVTVNQPTITITLPETATVNKDATVTLTPTVTVSIGTNAIEAQPVIEWSSSDTSKATVNENGVVTGVAGGEVTITAKVTKLTVGDVTFAVSGEFSDTTTVTVTEIPMVGFDLDNMPTEIVLDAKENKEILIPLKFAYSGIQNTEAVKVMCQPVDNTAGTNLNASYDPQTKILTLTGIDECEGILLVNITEVTGEGDIQIDQNKKTYHIQFVVNDNSDVANGTLTLTDSSMTLTCGQTAELPGVSKLMHGTYEVPVGSIDSITYSTASDDISVVEGQVTAGESESAENKVTVTVTYDYGGEKKTATADVVINVNNRASAYSVEVTPEEKVADIGSTVALKAKFSTVDPEYTGTPEITWQSSNTDIATVDASGVVTVVGYGDVTITASAKIDDQLTVTDTAVITGYQPGIVLDTDFKSGTQYTVSVGTQMNVRPFVHLADFTSTYTVTWSTSDSSKVTVDEYGNITTVGTGEAEITATLATVNGQPVPAGTVISDSYKVNVVQNAVVVDSTKENPGSFIPVTDANDVVLYYKDNPETTVNPNYVFRIKDLHTLQEFDIDANNARDARILAVEDDTRIDFSAVKVHVYTTDGQLVVDSSGNPIEIDTSQLAFWDISTDEVGWDEVRVTYPDYYAGEVYTQTEEQSSDCYFVNYVSTGADGADGIVDMYVHEKLVYSATSSYVVYDESSIKYTLYTFDSVQEGEYVIADILDGQSLPMSNDWNLSAGAALTFDEGVIKSDISSAKWTIQKSGDFYWISYNNAYLATSGISGNDTSADLKDRALLNIVLKNASTGAYTIEMVNEDGTSTGYYLDLINEYGSIHFEWTEDSNAEVILFNKSIDSTSYPVTVTATDIRPTLDIDGKSISEANTAFSIAINAQGADAVLVTGEYSNIYTGPAACWTTWVEGALENTYEAGGLGVEAGSSPGMGYFYIEITKVKVNDVWHELEDPIVLEIPIDVINDSVKPIPNITDYRNADAWGDTNHFGYNLTIGEDAVDSDGVSRDISAFAREFVSDIVMDDYFAAGLMLIGGNWETHVVVNAPMGTAPISMNYHSLTLDDGTVHIFAGDSGTVDLTGNIYEIDVVPEVVILKVGETYDLSDIVTRSEDGADITNEDNVKVTWTSRGPQIAAIDKDSSNLVLASDQCTVTAVSTGVTYVTALLQQAVQKDGTVDYNLGSQLIADYAIIYVVDEDYVPESMDVVVDYGKPIKIDISAFLSSENTDYNFIGFTDLEHSLRKHAYTEYGEIEINEAKEVFYTPLKMLTGVDPIYVIFQYIDKDSGTYYWHHYMLNIIPATVMYYETDGSVASEFTYVGDWGSEETPNGVAASESYDPAVQDDYVSDVDGGEQIYGYDSSYDYDAHLSNQSSMFVEGTTTAAEIVANNSSTSASFSFQGTGFDIIARTGDQQATLRVHVYNSSGDKVKTVSVICKGTNELYQIPVIAVRDLSSEPATYRVEIIVYASYTAPAGLEQLSRGNEFYFDAIRIYDPVKGNAIAEAAYAADGEAYQTISPIGSLLVDLKTYETLGQDAVGTGAVFMDSYTLDSEVDTNIGTSGTDGFVQTSAVGTYQAYGPNNEVYLGKDQGIAFILNTNGTMPASIQIGAKSITGDPVTLNAKLVKATTANNNTTYAATDHTLQQSINTCTAMYYELLSAADSGLFADGNQVYVVIWNTGDTVLSITDIKFAYKEATAQAVEFLYSAELASVAAATISEYEDQTYLKRIGEDWCYCDSNGEVIVYSGLVQTQDSGIWYVVDGKVDFSYSGLYRTEAGERYSVRSGRVETTLNGIVERDGQWLYFTAGRVDTDFTGIASYGDTGEWYVLNGEVQVSNSETITLNGVTYNLENGKVISNS